jgi:UDP-N-acetylmuramate dehydrogenase
MLVLGGGSTLLVSDDGFDGLVLRVDVRGIDVRPAGAHVEVEAGAGEPWDGLVAAVVERGLGGIECLSGIPGLVGATPIQNVGAYGQEVAETIVRVRALESATGTVVDFAAEDCRFGYRESRFKLEDRGRYVVLSVAYRLAADASPSVRYPELARELDARDERSADAPTLADARAAVLAVRRRKSMVTDPDDVDSRSAGSFFVNPIVPVEIADAIGLDGMPRYPVGDRVKLSAAWLIERAGFARGTTRGRAAISSKHTLALVNLGGARASEIVALAREVRDGVRERFDITLVPEPVLVGLTI